MRVLQWHQHSFFEQALGLIKSYDVCKVNSRIDVDDFILDAHCQLFKLRVEGVVRQWFKDSVLKKLFDLVFGLGFLLLFYFFALDLEGSRILVLVLVVFSGELLDTLAYLFVADAVETTSS